ncbi:MAG: ABC transporter ATP-binding protein [Clostridia bacterium]|nr:ABC transporter ATP-binding protein [Clostridia bacterium]
MDLKPVITVDNLRTYFYNDKRCNKVLNGISFKLFKGRTLCVVGESGCGKSVTASSIMQLLPVLSRIESGSITYHGDKNDIRIDQLERNGKTIRKLRGSDLAMIFQDPMTALNPVYTIGWQIMENLKYHTSLNMKERRKKAIDLLEQMGVSNPGKRVDQYPHELSGGMRQRAMIAMAMSCNPKVLIADEPTTALDVTIQAQIFELITQLKAEHETAVMLITHDMGVVSELADDVAVMYMGNIVEQGPVREVLKNPSHPYTSALLRSIPVLHQGASQDLQPIRGVTPDPLDRPKGCQFGPRCDFYTAQCDQMPDETAVDATHFVRCWHADACRAAQKPAPDHAAGQQPVVQ